MKYYKLLFIILAFSSCTKRTEINYNETKSIKDLLSIAKEENKYIYVEVFHGDCHVCEDLDDLYRETEIDTFLNNNYIFKKNNFNLLEDYSLSRTFKIRATPSFCVFSDKGELVYLFEGLRSKDFFLNNLKAALVSKGRFCPNYRTDLHTSEKNIYKVYNNALKANNILKDYSGSVEEINEALEFAKTSINIQPYFYNLYLAYKCYCILDDQEHAIKYANKALAYDSKLNQNIYEYLFEELNKYLMSKSGLIDNNNAPHAYFENSSHDFGKINLNKEYVCKFKYKNTGLKPLIIHKIHTSCNCSTPLWDKEPLLPNETVELTLKFKSDEKGRFLKTINIISNNYSGVISLQIKGYVK